MYFEARGLKVFGPRKNAAILEGSEGVFKGSDEEIRIFQPRHMRTLMIRTEST